MWMQLKRDIAILSCIERLNGDKSDTDLHSLIVENSYTLFMPVTRSFTAIYHW